MRGVPCVFPLRPVKWPAMVFLVLLGLGLMPWFLWLPRLLWLARMPRPLVLMQTPSMSVLMAAGMVLRQRSSLLRWAARALPVRVVVRVMCARTTAVAMAAAPPAPSLATSATMSQRQCIH